MQNKRPPTNPSELQIALDNRAFEIQMFWQRSNYFLVLMTALGIGVFTIKTDLYALLIAIFATITSWYWYKTNLGSKFWHESWEVEVVALAKELGIRSFERPTKEVIDQVRLSFEASYLSGDKSRARRWIDDQVLKKPSVSHYMILLSLTSMVLWALVSVSYGYNLGQSFLHSSIKFPHKKGSQQSVGKRAHSYNVDESGASRRQDNPGQLATQQRPDLNGKISASPQPTISARTAEQPTVKKPGGSQITTSAETPSSSPACTSTEASSNQT